MDSDQFGGALRVLNQVPRWGCVPRIKDNNVAQHSYWVTVYTGLLCRFLDLSVAEELDALRWAIRHDMREAASGDILGPVKRSAVDKERLEAYTKESFDAWGVSSFTDQTRLPESGYIVKAADIIDDLMVMAEETALGNQRTQHLVPHIERRLDAALGRIGCDDLFHTILASRDVVLSSALTIIQEDSDLAGIGPEPDDGWPPF